MSRTNYVIDQVAFVVDQHLLSGGCCTCIAGHRVVVVKTNDLAGAAEFVVVFAVPERQQNMAVGTEEHAELGILEVAQRSFRTDLFVAGIARCRQFVDFSGA